MVAFGLDPSLLITAIASRCVTLVEYNQTTNNGIAPCLPALTNTTAPLELERALVAKSVAAFSDYFGLSSGLVVEVDRKRFAF